MKQNKKDELKRLFVVVVTVLADCQQTKIKMPSQEKLHQRNNITEFSFLLFYVNNFS